MYSYISLVKSPDYRIVINGEEIYLYQHSVDVIVDAISYVQSF